MMELETLNIKLLRSHKAALRRMAIAEGRSIAIVVRRILYRALEDAGYLKPGPPGETAHELAKILSSG